MRLFPGHTDGRRASSRILALVFGLSITVMMVMALLQVSLAERSADSPPRGGAETVPVPGGSGTLVIQDLQLESGGSDTEAIVSFDIAWEGSGFPGVRECTWRALASDGTELGRYSDRVATLTPVDNLSVSVPVTRKPDAADASCGSRLDAGSPYEYEFSNVSLSKGDTKEAAYDVRVRFDARWLGGGQAGAVACVFSLFDEDGATIVTDNDNLLVLEGEGVGLGHTVLSESLAAARPMAADIDCEPFVGG